MESRDGAAAGGDGSAQHSSLSRQGCCDEPHKYHQRTMVGQRALNSITKEVQAPEVNATAMHPLTRAMGYPLPAGIRTGLR